MVIYYFQFLLLNVSENGKELLSVNDVLLYLLKISKPLVDKRELSELLELEKNEWDKFVDSFRHVIVSCPGKVIY